MKIVQNKFTYNQETEEWISNKTYLGLGTGDDKKLIIYFGDKVTLIYWREKRGYETTIFQGREIEESELEKLFNLLGIEWNI